MAAENFYKNLFKLVLCACFAMFYGIGASGQAVITSTTNPPYFIVINLATGSLANRVCSTGSFSYQPVLNYTITCTSTSAAPLSSLSGSFFCGTNISPFVLPTSPGAGSILGKSIVYTGSLPCSTATVSSMGCNSYSISYRGPEVLTGSTFILAPAIALPIDLLRFDLRKQGEEVYITWERAKGSTLPITLQVSTDGFRWVESTVRIIRSEGLNSWIFGAYDVLPTSGFRYYRLQGGGAEGETTYSKTLAIQANADLGQIAVTPNPVTSGPLHIVGLDDPAAWEFSIHDMTSQRIYYQAVATDAINLDGLTPGCYFLKLRHRENNSTRTLRFLKS